MKYNLKHQIANINVFVYGSWDNFNKGEKML